MKIRFPFACLGSFVFAIAVSLAWASSSWATTVLVNDAGDDLNNPGCATTGTGTCTLRDAITYLNNNPGTNDEIDFADSICSGGCTISPLAANGPLPTLSNSNGIFINGYSVTTSSPNSLATGSDAVLRVELDGSSASVGANGLTIDSSNNAIQGLVINGFDGGNGIGFLSGSNNLVSGNFIGTNVAGSASVPNSAGVRLNGSSTSGNTIGGFSPGSRNLISGNNANGVEINAQAASNFVMGNYIGTNAAGTAAVSNGFLGIEVLDSMSNVIGGMDPGARNVISGNNASGIQIDGDTATGNQILGNYIGTDATGTVALPNDSDGMGLGSASNRVGGVAPGEGNVISGNSGGGINLFLGSTDSQIQGNFIGVDANGKNPLGNGTGGIFIFTDNNTIGGTLPGAGNIIAFNGSFGIATADNAGPGNAIWGNSIFSNGELAIDLLQDGITANDAGDGDTGPNNLQNFPDLSSAVSANGSTTIQGTLDSPGGASFRVEFFSNDACDGSGNGEGQTFLGAVDVPNGNFNVVLPVALLNPLSITATATDNATNDTSEFSKCLQSTVLVEDCDNAADDDGDTQVDCGDSDCSADPACLQEICDNGIDDDGDTLADCNDADCIADPACAPEDCDNAVDDDGDGLVDCTDSDCTLNAVCALAVSGSGCALTQGNPGNSIVLWIPLFAMMALSLRRRLK